MSSPKIGLFCDVDGDAGRLMAALRALREAGCGRVACLGDLVSARGPFEGSAACLAMALDEGVLHLAGPAERQREADLSLPEPLRHRLGGLPSAVHEGGAMLCRGSPLRPEKARRLAGGFDAALVLKRLRAAAAFFASPLAGAWLGGEIPAPFRDGAALCGDALQLGRSSALVAVGSLAAQRPAVAVFDPASLTVRWRFPAPPARRAA